MPAETPMLLASLVVAALAGGASPVSGADASFLVRMIDLAREPASLSTWEGRKRSKCTPFHARGHESHYEELWCTECVVSEGAASAAFRFYPDLAAGTCTLQEMSVDLGPGRHERLVDLETVVTGLGRPVPVYPTDVSERGCGSWLSIRRWSVAGHLAYLHVVAEDRRHPPPPHRIGFLWRRSPLVDRERNDASIDGVYLPNEDGWPLEACRDAGLPGCDIAALLTRESAAMRTTALAALDRFEKQPRSAPLVYWLDVLASDHHALIKWGDEADRAELAKRGVVYVDGYSTTFASPWLRDVAERDETSKWGQRAFLRMIRTQRWQSDDDDAPFRAVIERVEPFLRRRSGSSVENALRFELALAYESWWSLAKSDTEFQDPEDLQRWRKGAERARLRAIELYGLVQPTDEDKRDWIAQRLFRLRRDIDTGQRAYAPSEC